MIAYIIKVILCTAVFTLTYKLLFEKEKMYTFNRVYLLLSLLLSFAIPAINFSYTIPMLPMPENEDLHAGIINDTEINQILSVQQNTDFSFLILLVVYIIITAILFFRFIINLHKILSIAITQETIPYKNSKIVLINENLPPHSFLNYLFINKKEYQNIEKEILLHEYAHIQQKHSYDILILEFLQTFFWFNPILFIYRKAIQLNHELLADEAVIKTTQNISGYQYLLINKVSENKTYHLTSRFNYSITKKRLLMMNKTKSFKTALLRQIAVVPVLALTVFLFSTKTAAQDTSTTAKSKKVETPSTQEGVSQELLNEYEQIINKTKNEKGAPSFNKFSDKDKNRLETIYLSMSKEQQAKQTVIFIPAPPPLPKIVPTQAQVESWKNAKVYGLWINEKRVSNATLTNYKNTDFAQVSVSKLGKNTVNYGKHYYQVDLMTKEYYDAYYKKATENNKKYYLAIRFGKK